MSAVSIGSVGSPYFDSINDRTKGFLTTVHCSLDAVRETLSGILAEHKRGSRMTIRVFTSAAVSRDAVRAITLSDGLRKMQCEALIPVERKGVDAIVYFGWNASSRYTSRALWDDEWELVSRATRRHNGHRVLPSGYRFCMTRCDARGYSPSDIQTLLTIYRRDYSGYLVEFTEASVREMLEVNWVATVRHEKTIVAVAMAELAEISVGTETLSLAEISEVATHPDHLRRGLGHATVSSLAARLQKQEIDVVYSETRANHYAIHAVTFDAGLRPWGMLMQHCVISSPFADLPQAGPHGDLVVFALPPR